VSDGGPASGFQSITIQRVFGRKETRSQNCEGEVNEAGGVEEANGLMRREGKHDRDRTEETLYNNGDCLVPGTEDNGLGQCDETIQGVVSTIRQALHPGGRSDNARVWKAV
jgi:hypothetical protein